MRSKTAIILLLIIIAAVTVFHFCILFKIVPYDIAWGGHLNNNSEMYVFESVSIAINLFLGLTLLISGGYIKRFFSFKTEKVIFWIFLILFILNTIGNIFAKTLIEKGFSILTLFMAFLIGVILKEKGKKKISAAEPE